MGTTTDTVTFRVDHDTKVAAAQIAADFGLDLSAVLRIFLRQIVLRREIPVKLSYPDADPFYSEQNMAALRRGMDAFDRGDIVHKTMDELREMA
jgi:DNA-damage-inducible protein J